MALPLRAVVVGAAVVVMLVLVVAVGVGVSPTRKPRRVKGIRLGVEAEVAVVGVVKQPHSPPPGLLVVGVPVRPRKQPRVALGAPKPRAMLAASSTES